MTACHNLKVTLPVSAVRLHHAGSKAAEISHKAATLQAAYLIRPLSLQCDEDKPGSLVFSFFKFSIEKKNKKHTLNNSA